MCARYTITKEKKELLDRFVDKTLSETYAPNWNIAPTQLAPVIIADRPDEIQMFHFGLIPYWAKDTKTPMMNAKQETVLELKTFKPLMQRNKRCLILADGFYEWRTDGKQKLPYRFILPKQEIFCFAGLWSQWKQPDNPHNIYESFAIITTTPNNMVGTIHNRMPVILAKEEESLWLSGEVKPEELLQFCDPYPDDDMGVYRVSQDVNNARNNHSDLILPANSI